MEGFAVSECRRLGPWSSACWSGLSESHRRAVKSYNLNHRLPFIKGQTPLAYVPTMEVRHTIQRNYESPLNILLLCGGFHPQIPKYFAKDSIITPILQIWKSEAQMGK